MLEKVRRKETADFVRDRLLDLNVATAGEVAFLDGVVFYERDEHLWLRGLSGDAVRVDLTICDSFSGLYDQHA